MKKTFKLKTDEIVVGLLVFVTLVAGGMLASIGVKADSDNTTVVDEITIMIPVACSMSGTVTSVHTDTVTAASYNEDIGVTDLKATCNDFDGFSIYAVGFTDDTEGTTTMKGASSNLTISTGTATSGDTSNWAMKLTAVTDPSITYNPSNLSVVNGFGSYSAIPANFTKVVEYKDSGDGPSATDQALGAHVQTTYAAYVSAVQAADTYTGQVKYVLVHPASFTTGTYNITYNTNGGSGAMNSESNIPNYEPHIIPASTITPPSGYVLAGWCTVRDSSATAQNPQTTCTGTSYSDAIPASEVATNTTLNLYAYWRRPTLYETVAAMSKGKQTNDTNDTTGIQAAIRIPTSADRTQDTSNSGVYEYDSDPNAFGPASDASNTSKIYYYRGVLENSVGSYGSDGSAVTYPNYVILQSGSSKATTDTCWRIVRTTGSGGVKMIYNGKWTGSTCANSTSNADAVSSVYFNRGTTSSTNNYGTKGRVAYVGYNYNSDYGYGGSGANEDNSIANSTLFSNGVASNARTQLESWYNSNITAYTSILETSAGYCNDRTTYTGKATNTLSTSTIPYKTSSATVNFGAYIRNVTANDHPTLGCPNTTGQDLLTTSNGLGVPAALLTADEASFAGSGYGTSYGSSYHVNSFLRSGGYFWLLSPSTRDSIGTAGEFILASGGTLYRSFVDSARGVRPAISLKPGTIVGSGTGIATDPWVVTAP